MARFKVVNTGARGRTLDVEREAVKKAGIDAEVVEILCSTARDVAEKCKDADVLLNTFAPINREAVAGLQKCKAVLLYSVGYDRVELQACSEKGIMVANNPDFCIEEVANHAIMLLLAATKKLVRLDKLVREGRWGEHRNWILPMGHIHGETLGLVACGNIARAVARRAQAMNMEVIGYDPYISPDILRSEGIEPVGFDELFRRSDYISCHLPHSPATHHMIGEKQFRSMKPNAIFVNTSRGKVVDEQALIRALKEGWIRGAGLDVFEEEPTNPENPLLRMDNVVLTPHTASASDYARDISPHKVAAELVRVLTGHYAANLVNKELIGKLNLKRATYV